MELRDHRANYDLGQIIEITPPTKISDGSGSSPKNQDHGPIFVIIDTTKIFEGSSRSPRQPSFWTDLQDHRANYDLEQVFEITQPTEILV